MGGILCVSAIIFIDRKINVDDPVGAISVHLVCGVWGTLAVGLFGDLASSKQLLSQFTGIGVVAGFVVASSFLLAFAIKVVMGLRVDQEVEVSGLDHHEHEASAYRGTHIAWNRRASDSDVAKEGLAWAKKDGSAKR